MFNNKEKLGISYPLKCYKLSPEIIKELDALHKEENCTYNILFKLIINGYKINKILNSQYYEISKNQLKKDGTNKQHIQK